jgi:hypothetical protein
MWLQFIHEIDIIYTYRINGGRVMNRKLFAFLLTLLLVMALVFTACDVKDKSPKETPEPTDTATKAPTPEPTPTPTPKPTVEPISEEKKGVPQEDAEVLFKDTFDEDNLEQYLLKQGEFMIVEDGRLLIPENWSAYIPDVTYDLGVDHSQYEMSVKFKAEEGGDSNPWASLFIGCRGDATTPIATSNGYFWVAFNFTNKAFVYPGGGGQYEGDAWNLRYFEIELPEDFTEDHTVTVVDCGDVIAYYMNTEEEDYYLILKATFEGDEIVIFGNDGSEIWRETNMIADTGMFMFFNHYCNSSVDEIVIKGLK